MMLTVDSRVAIDGQAKRRTIGKLLKGATRRPPIASGGSLNSNANQSQIELSFAGHARRSQSAEALTLEGGVLTNLGSSSQLPGVGV